jgi:hypothetical protein
MLWSQRGAALLGGRVLNPFSTPSPHLGGVIPDRMAELQERRAIAGHPRLPQCERAKVQKPRGLLIIPTGFVFVCGHLPILDNARLARGTGKLIIRKNNPM